MSIVVSRYVLRPRYRPNARSAATERAGALLRADGGFADLHPWPELGDAPLDDQLASLAADAPTSLARRSLACARADGEARAAGRSLFEGLEIPPSHRLVLDGDDVDFEEIAASGFRSVKVKAGTDARADAERLIAFSPALLGTPLRLRIDVNAAFTAAELDAFLEKLPASLRERIEFLEDPVPADAPAWSAIRSRWDVALAADREKPDPSCWDIAVIKPASEGEEIVEEASARGKAIVFTSSMDHPLGQLWAAWNAAVAASSRRVLDCGLLTHELYEPTPFSERLRTDGPTLVPPGGTGLGFDDLLEKKPWEKLA